MPSRGNLWPKVKLKLAEPCLGGKLSSWNVARPSTTEHVSTEEALSPVAEKGGGIVLEAYKGNCLLPFARRGLPKWAVGNFSSFFFFSFLPSSHGFRDEAYGGGRKEDEDPFFFSRMAATAF